MYYVESGNINLIRLVLSYVFGLLISFLFGYFYTFLTLIIPFVYFNIVITVVVAFNLGLICNVINRFSHNRNKKSRIIFAVIVGLFANFFQVTTFIVKVYYGQIPSVGLYLSYIHIFFNPINIFYGLSEINQVGTWSFLSIPFNGIILTVVWVIEFLIIWVVPIVVVLTAKQYPYSELLKKRYRKYTLFKDFESISSSSAVVDDLLVDPKKTIENLEKGIGYRHSKIHVYFLEGEESQYLTIEKIHIENKGSGYKMKSIVLPHFKISNSDAKYILEKFQNKLAKIELI
jgi:hypothetical protein